MMSNLPANRNVKWALSAGLWSHYPPGRFTRILDVMRDTGFIGIRLTGFPGILKKYNLTRSQLESEVSRRSLYVTTISFDGPTNDASQHKRIVKQAREAMQFLKSDGSALIWTGLASYQHCGRYIVRRLQPIYLSQVDESLTSQGEAPALVQTFRSPAAASAHPGLIFGLSP